MSEIVPREIRWITLKEAARISGASTRTLHRWRSEQRLREKIESGRVLVAYDDLPDSPEAADDANDEDIPSEHPAEGFMKQARALLRDTQMQFNKFADLTTNSLQVTNGQLLKNSDYWFKAVTELRSELDSTRKAFDELLDHVQTRDLEQAEMLRKQARRDQIVGFLGAIALKRFDGNPATASAIREFIRQDHAVKQGLSELGIDVPGVTDTKGEPDGEAKTG